MKRVLIIQDICVFGKTSESVSIPIFSSMQMETVFVPVYLQMSECISTNNFKTDLSDKFSVYKDFFIENKIRFDCIFISGNFSDEQIYKINNFIDSIKSNDCIIFSNLLLKYTKTLLGKSNVSILNFSDANTLMNLKDELSKEVIEEKIKSFSSYFEKIIIKDFPVNDKKTCVICYDKINDKISWIYHKRYNTSFYGLESIFASVSCVFFLNNDSLEDSVRKTISFIEKAINTSVSRFDYNWYGVDFERILKDLALESL